jgi:hypothetical protein
MKTFLGIVSGRLPWFLDVSLKYYYYYYYKDEFLALQPTVVMPHRRSQE